MDLNHQKEQFSNAFVRAIAAQAGCNYQTLDVDDMSIDFSLVKHISVRFSNPQLNIQLKSTSHPDIQNGHVIYRLPKKNYNDLRNTRVQIPFILVLVCLNEQIQDWIHYETEQMILFKNAFWFSLYGMGESDLVDKIPIRIPLSNRFNAEFLTNAMEHIASNGRLS